MLKPRAPARLALRSPVTSSERSSHLLSSEQKSLLWLQGTHRAINSAFRTHGSHQQKPKIHRKSGFTRRSSTWSNLDVFKGNIHGLFFPILEEKKPPVTVFIQKLQGLAGGRSMGWWGGRVGRGLRPETARPSAASGPFRV